MSTDSPAQPKADAALLLSRATSAASYTIGLQIVFRLLNFALNAVVLRRVPTAVLGVANVRLALLHSTTVFFAREAVRKACLETGGATLRQRTHMTWLCAPLGLVLGLTLQWVWGLLTEVPVDMAGYHASAGLFVLAAVLELLSEPLWMYASVALYVRLQALAEGAAVAAKALLLTALVVVLGAQEAEAGAPPALLPPLVMFGAAQAAYGATLCVVYGAAIATDVFRRRAPGLRQMSDLLPKGPEAQGESWLAPAQVAVAVAFTKQGLLQQLLSNGERYMMALFGALSLADQGVYDVVHNLGSLAARLVFRPIEQSFYMFFATTLGRSDASAAATAAAADARRAALAANTLATLLRTVVVLGLLIAVFAQPFSALALDIYGGARLSAAPGPLLLRCYGVYVLCMAMNGITECFVFAAAKASYIDSFNRLMVAISVVFLAISWVLTRPTALGSAGFIVANSCNMILRFAHHVWFIRRYYANTPHEPIRKAMPSMALLGTFAAGFVVTMLSKSMLLDVSGEGEGAGAGGGQIPSLARRAAHVGVGVCAVAAVAVTMLLNSGERKWLRDLWRLRQGRGGGRHQD